MGGSAGTIIVQRMVFQFFSIGLGSGKLQYVDNQNCRTFYYAWKLDCAMYTVSHDIKIIAVRKKFYCKTMAV